MIAIVSSSLRPDSRSDRLAVLALELLLTSGHPARLLRLRDHPLPPFADVPEVYQNDAYTALHRATEEADSLVFATPVYNWSFCAELKRYIEFVGSTPPDGSLRGAFFDKVVSVLAAGGLPQSYMATGPLLLGMLYDFRCILNPFPTYASNDDWSGDAVLSPACHRRLERTLAVHTELAEKLAHRSYRSGWSL